MRVCVYVYVVLLSVCRWIVFHEHTYYSNTPHTTLYITPQEVGCTHYLMFKRGCVWRYVPMYMFICVCVCVSTTCVCMCV